MGSVGKTALALTVSLMIASGAATAAQAPVVKSDPQAWAQIEAALLKFTHVRSFRVKGWFSGLLGGAVEVVNPDREHIVTVGGGNISEWIQVGNDIRWRDSSDSSSGDFLWWCGKSASRSTDDLLIVLGMYLPAIHDVTVARGPAAIVNGIPTQTFTYKRPDESFSFRLFVADATGLPKRIQGLEAQEEVVLQADFFDYDAPIAIVLPNQCRADQHK